MNERSQFFEDYLYIVLVGDGYLHRHKDNLCSCPGTIPFLLINMATANI